MTKECMDCIEAVVRQAGEILLSAHAESSEVSCKPGEANFVTYWDVKIQQYLQAELGKLLPQAAFFGEEDTEGNLHALSDGYTFIIDPIDGTTNFIFGYRHSCISVGLAKGTSLEAGFVYNPYVNEMFCARKGEGAYLNGLSVTLKDIPVGEGIVSFGCARYNDMGIDRLFNVVKELFFQSLSVREGGSAAIDLSRIASGSNAAYFEMKLQPYDYAASALIIREAGGIITQLDGSPITLDKPCSILAGTPTAHRQILEMFQKQGI